MQNKLSIWTLAGLLMTGAAMAQQPPEPPEAPRAPRAPKAPKPPKPPQAPEDAEHSKGERQRSSHAGSGPIALDERRSFVAKGGVVEIENAMGTIRVSGWERAEIAVTGQLGARAEGLEFQVSGDRATIGIEAMNPHGVSSDLDIKVPAGSDIEIDAFGAETSVTGVGGSVQVESVNGSISVSGNAKGLELQTVNGSIEVAAGAGQSKVEAVNGNVTLKGVGGDVEASTVNGRLSVDGGAFSRGHFETVAGQVAVHCELSKNARLEIESVSGPVELSLPASVSARFEVSTFSGEVKNELSADQAKRSSRYTTEQELSFETGSAGATVEIQTLSGDVTLRKH